MTVTTGIERIRIRNYRVLGDIGLVNRRHPRRWRIWDVERPKSSTVAAACEIAPHMDVENNRSQSFQVFRDGLRRLVSEES